MIPTKRKNSSVTNEEKIDSFVTFVMQLFSYMKDPFFLNVGNRTLKAPPEPSICNFPGLKKCTGLKNISD